MDLLLREQALSAAQKASLQEHLGIAKWINTSDYGASTEASAADNVTAFQAALDAADDAGGGTVLIDKAGTYQLNDTLFIGDYTTLAGCGGVVLKKATGSNYGCVIINNGASTGTTNYGIKLRDFNISVNGVDVAGDPVARVRGQVSLVYVDGVEIENVNIPDNAKTQYAFHFSRWAHLTCRNIRVDGPKDVMNFGWGHGGYFENIVGNTYDDLFGIHAGTYWSVLAGGTGDIRDMTFVSCRREYRASQAGYFARLSSGAWGAWTLGASYIVGNRVVANGNVYCCKSPTDSPAVAANEPSHSSGEVTGADGITWLFDHVGTETTARVTDITFIDCVDEGKTPFIVLAANDPGYNYTQPIDGSTEAYVDNLRIYGGRFEYQPGLGAVGSIVSGSGYVKRVAVHGLKCTGATYVICATCLDNFTPATDPRDPHVTDLYLQDCEIETGSLMANRQNLTVNVWVKGLKKSSGLLGVYPGLTGTVRVNGDATISVLDDVGGCVEGDNVRNGTYNLGRWVSSRPCNPLRHLMPFGSESHSGTGAASTVLDGAIDLYAGTAAAGYAFARYMESVTSHRGLTGEGINFTQPMTFAGKFSGHLSRASAGAFRFIVGGPDTPTLSDADAFADKAIGIEWGTIPSGNQAARLIYYNGGYIQGSWIDLGRTPSAAVTFVWALTSLGDGTLKMYVATNLRRWDDLPLVPSIVVADGPTGMPSGAGRFIGYAAVAHSTTVPSVNQIRGIFWPLWVDFSVPA